MTVKLLSSPLAVQLRDAKSVFNTLRYWAHRQHERKQLLDLDERMLRDIGLDRAAAEREASKPFWVA